MKKDLIKKIVLSTLMAATLVITGTFTSGISVFADGYVTTEQINLRDEMDLDLSPLGTIPAGTEVNIISVSENGAWAKVEYNGNTGYILTMYLKEGSESTDATSNDETATEKKQISTNNGSKVIVIDPGHGGDDPGAVAYHDGVSMEEADYAMAIASYLQEYLEAYGYNVIMTRDGDLSITMKERVALANSNNADLYFSMHHNAAPSAVNGGLVIYPTEKSNGDSSAISESQSLASAISEGYEGTGMDNEGARADADISGYPLYVLTNTDMVSILAEMGFITNEGDASLIADPSFQKELAQNFADRIHAYYSN